MHHHNSFPAHFVPSCSGAFTNSTLMPRVARINLLLQHGDPPYFGEGHMSNAQTPPTDFTVFVDGVPYDWSIERVTEFFSKCGPVREVRAPTWQDSGRLRGYAHVAFEGAAGKEKALKLDKAKVGKKGRYLKIEPAKKPNEGKAAAGDIEGKRRLFVKNLPYDAAEDDIAKLFSKCGKVLEIRIPHTSGRSKGFAYVEFAKAQGLRTAMELDPAPSLQGRKLLLDADVGSGPKAGFHHRPDAFQSNFGPKKKGQGKGGRGGRGGRGRGKPSLF
ncbi:unnamed protein product [Durusdinium trenchii]|uniref:RRM domain-containing protein n=1 Tax=Durusdinium trenchii TaxID=1381693 RepID=A0ABP0J1W5_9DINO